MISHRKKKKDKNRRTSGDITLAMADKEGNDETRALRGMLEFIYLYSDWVFRLQALTALLIKTLIYLYLASIRQSVPIDMRISISPNPSPEDEITCASSPATENVIEDKDEVNDEAKYPALNSG